MSQTVLTVLISIFGGGVTGSAIVSWLKDRKKDDATAKLTDVEAVQKQVALLTTVTDFLRKENGQLQAELETETKKNRIMRMRVVELEEELQAVQRSARQTQMKCDDLSAKLKKLANDEENNEDKPNDSPRRFSKP